MSKLQTQLDQHRQRVDVDHLDIPIRELLRMLEDRELSIAPEYQRQFRWDGVRSSELIESLLLGLPVPPLFVATNEDATWELVDGLQRVSSIVHFMGSDAQIAEHLGPDAKRLKLNGLKKLNLFNGESFESIPTPVKIALSRRPVRVTALSDKSQLEVRFDLFERLNRGGIVLTPQEIRACIYRGQLNTFISRAALNEKFVQLLKLQRVSQSDGTREEQVLKFFAYLYGRSKFKGAVTTYLNEFMATNRDAKDLDAWETLFARTVDALWDIFEGPMLKGRYPLTPLVQFEAFMVAAAETLNEGHKVKGTSTIMNDPELIQHSTGATNTPKALRGRIDRARVLLQG